MSLAVFTVKINFSEDYMEDFVVLNTYFHEMICIFFHKLLPRLG